MVGDGPGGAVAFTEQKSIGGRIWPNVMFDDEAFDAAFAVWGNSTLGLLSHWWHSNRQQSSKAGMTIRPAESLPVVDFRTLSDAQLYTVHAIFDDFRQLDLQPAYLADADAKDAANGPGRSSTESVSRFYAAHAAHTMISQGVPTPHTDLCSDHNHGHSHTLTGRGQSIGASGYALRPTRPTSSDTCSGDNNARLTASGSLAITCRSDTAGPLTRRVPCSHFR